MLLHRAQAALARAPLDRQAISAARRGVVPGVALCRPPSSTMAAASTAAEPQPHPTGSPDDPIVQYVVIRRDLWAQQGWPLGPVVAQACHAAVAAIVQEPDDPCTRAYTAAAALDHMHKVVLEVKSEDQLKKLSSQLQQAGVRHKLWVEQPENYPTCLATKPYPRSSISVHFRKLQLCKAAVGAPAAQQQQQQQAQQQQQQQQQQEQQQQ